MYMSRRPGSHAAPLATPVGGRPSGALPARDVMIFADWEELPEALSFAGSGLDVRLCSEDDLPRALDLVMQRGAALDAVVLDTDFFGCPEESADFCFSLRRLAPWVRILVLESELWEERDALNTLGACDISLPSYAGPLRIHETLVQNVAVY